MIPARLLPPVQSPPHDPHAMTIGPANAWAQARFDGIHLDSATGQLLMDASLATQRTLTEDAGSFGGLALPGNVTATPQGDVFLIDRKGTLRRFDPCECRFDVLPCVANQAELQGLGICGNNLYICDAGRRRLIVLSLRHFAPVGLWEPPRRAYQGSSPDLTSAWSPFDVAFDSRGGVYVSDTANGCIHRFSPRGTWLGCVSGLGPVTHLAMDCRDHLYAIVKDSVRLKVADTQTLAVTEVDSTTRASRPETLAPSFPSLPIRVDRDGFLHLGGLCVPPTNTGVFDLDGNAVDFQPHPVVPPFLKTGWLTTGPLDSEIYRCVWHRSLLVGEIPEGARIQVASFTSEIPMSEKDIDEIFDRRQLTRTSEVRINRDGVGDALIQSEPARYLWMRIQFSGDGHTSPRLKHAEFEFPRISLRRYLPAVFGEEPVSADFTDRFLALFDTTLRSIETRLDNFAGYLDPASTPSIRRGGSIDFLTWLASWLGISFDRQWPEERRRRFLKQAGKLFPMRGTRTGLWSQLVIYLGMEPERICCDREPPANRCCPPPQCPPVVAESCRWVPPPLILEHYQLRRWLFLGMGRLQDQAVLWGRRVVNRSQLGERHAQAGETQLVKRQDPERDPFHFYAHQFSVFVPAWVGTDDRERKGLENLLKAESPAHAKWTIHYVEPRFRIGFQSMIGLDAVVGRYPMGVRMDEAQLGQGTILSPSPREKGTLAFRVGNATRVGSSTTLT